MIDKIININNIIYAIFGVSLLKAIKYLIDKIKKVIHNQELQEQCNKIIIGELVDTRIDKALERGYTYNDELKAINVLYTCYKDLNGNGHVQQIYEKYILLEVK